MRVACLSHRGPVADQIEAAGVPVTTFDAAGAADPRVPVRLARLMNEYNIDTVLSFLVHANTVSAAVSVRFPEVRWVQSIQTTQPTPRWHWWVQRVAAHAAAAVVVPSQSVATVAQRWADVPAEKLNIIPNAIDPAQYTRSVLPTQNPRPYPVTFLGRLDPIKDVPTLIAAVARLAGLVHLHVNGDGGDRDRILACIDRFNASALVTLHGATDRPAEILRRSGMLVLPSLAEGFGLVLIEAMAAGVPVVASDVPGIRDVVIHDQTGLLVPPRDPAALATAIRRIVDDAALRQRLIDGATNDVVTRFGWKTVLPAYERLLHLKPGSNSNDQAPSWPRPIA